MLVAFTSVVGLNCTTPTASFCERGHRGLARRLVAVRRRAVVIVAEHWRPHYGASSGAAVTFMMRGRPRR